MQNITYFLFWVLWPLLSKRIMPTCRTFDDKVHSWLLFWDIVKILQTFYWVLWEWLIVPINDDSIALEETLMPKVLKSTCSYLWCLCSYQKLTSSLTFFFWRYYKDIANLLFWELWECFAIPIKIIVLIYGPFSCFVSILRHCKEIEACYFG